MRKAITASLVYAAIILFLFLFVSFTQPDPPITTIPVPVEMSDEMVIENVKIENIGTNGEANAGGGTPTTESSNHPTPPDQGEMVVHSEESDFTHSTGQGGQTEVEHPAAPVRNPDAVFSFGTGGHGGGAGTGEGELFGNGSDKTPGNGNGGNGSGSRTVISSPCPPSVGAEEGDIYLTVWVDESGKVIKAENISSKTTTSSTAVINAAISGVVNCMRFNKVSGAPVTKLQLKGPIRIRRN